MKLALIIIAAVSLLAFILLFFTAPPTKHAQPDMPWQVVVHDPGHSEVFDIVLNKTTLQQAVNRFGQLEDVALYQSSAGAYNLEAYFGKVLIGPLSARVIVNLQAPEQEMASLAQNTSKRTSTENGSLKWILSPGQRQQQLLRKVTSLTFIPGYGGMDAAYLEQRFGAPQARNKVDEHSELWLYPHLGVRILLDTEGKEVFEYVAPGQFSTLLGDKQ